MSNNKNQKILLIIKIVHTLIWIFFNIVIIIALHEAFIARFELLFYTAVFLILIEALVLIINKWECPLTTIAKHYTKNRDPNFDIFLPLAIAKYNKEIYTIIIIIGIISIAIKNFI